MATPEWVVWGITVLGALVSAFLALRRVEREKDAAVAQEAVRITRLEHTVFGVQDDNGLKRDVAELKAAFQEWEIRDAERQKEFERAQDHLKRNTDQIAQFLRDERERTEKRTRR